MTKSKTLNYGIFVLAIIGVVFISGCISQDKAPTTTQPAEKEAQPQVQPQQPLKGKCGDNVCDEIL